MAFRYAFHQDRTQHPDLTEVKHKTEPPEDSTLRRSKRARTRNVIHPQLHCDPLVALTPYPSPTWIRRVFLSSSDAVVRDLLQHPIADPTAAWYSPYQDAQSSSQPNIDTVAMAHTFVEVRSVTTPCSESNDLPTITVELPSDDYLQLAHDIDYKHSQNKTQQQFRQLGSIGCHTADTTSSESPLSTAEYRRTDDMVLCEDCISTASTSPHMIKPW